LKGKPLHDGLLHDYQITDGSKLHLIVSPQTPNKPMKNAFVNELRLLASKWIENPNEREKFVTAFQTVNLKKRNEKLYQINFFFIGNEKYC